MSNDTAIKLFILETGIGKARKAIFEKQLSDRLGVKLCESFDEHVTHVVVDDDLDTDKVFRLLKIGQRGENNLKIIRSKWISLCISQKEFVDSHEFEVMVPLNLFLSTSSCSGLNECSFDKDAGNENNNTSSIQYVSPEPVKKKSRWVCMKSSKCVEMNHNKNVTDELEKLMKMYENLNEKWRALSYRKAITSIKNYPLPITSFQEAIGIPGVGSQLAEKICEIIDSGNLRKLKELNEQESIKSLEMFMNIWGAGPQTAKLWVKQGFRTLADLKKMANLTRHQQIGLQYYEELSEKMSRHEAEEIGDYVRETTSSLRLSCEVVVCGSFRRGRELCGDVDVLISHFDGKSHIGLFAALIEELKSSGFVTDQLVISNSGEQHKFLGICKLPTTNSKHRRLDIIVVPYNEFFPALLYFTGSGHFNRSMRNLASKKGMSLNEHGLFREVTRNKGEKMNSGIRIDTPNEESIFECLGVPHRPPEERDF